MSCAPGHGGADLNGGYGISKPEAEQKDHSGTTAAAADHSRPNVSSKSPALLLLIPFFPEGLSGPRSSSGRTLGKTAELLVPTSNCIKFVYVFVYPTPRAHVCEISLGSWLVLFEDRDWILALTLALAVVRPNLGATV